MRNSIALCMCLFVSLAWHGVAAQDSAQAPNWFTVELVVFEHASGRAEGAPPPDPYVPRLDGALRLEEVFEQLEGPVPEHPPDDRPGSAVPLLSPMYGREDPYPLPDFLPVPEDQRALKGALARLESSGAYRPLAYLAWRQRAVPVGGSQRVRVTGGRVLGQREPRPGSGPTRTLELPLGVAKAAEPQPLHELEGTVALLQQRFRHLDLDLALRRPYRPEPIRLAVPTGDDAYPAWRLKERRRVSPGEWQYFDHGQFGALALIRPWTAEEDEAEDAGRDGAAPKG